MFLAAIRNAETAAASLSPRTFQGILECLQNADDLGATELRVALRTGTRRELLIVHNGAAVSLANVAAMALPWLSTKVDDHQSSGRFGIGQKTLKALGGPLEIHGPPFHFQLLDDGPRVCRPALPVDGTYSPATRDTMVLVPLVDEIEGASVAAAVAELGVRSLVFLRTVRRLLFRDIDHPERDAIYALGVEPASAIRLRVGAEEWDVERLRLRVLKPTDMAGAYYERYWVELPVRSGEARRSKATGETTPLGLCICVNGTNDSSLYDRVPLPIRLGFPMSLNAQFDPDSARTTVRNEKWNVDRFVDLGHLVGSTALYAFEREAADAWLYVPLHSEERHTVVWVDAMLAQHVVRECHRQLVSELLLPTERGPKPVSEIVYEDENLESLLSVADQELLAPDRFALSPSSRDENGRWRSVLGELGKSVRLGIEDCLRLFDYPEHLRDRDSQWFVQIAAAAEEADLFDEFLSKASILLSDGRLVVCPTPTSSRVLVMHGDEGSLASRLDLTLKIHPVYLGNAETATAVRAKLSEAGVLIERCDEPIDALNRLARRADGLEKDGGAALQLRDGDLLDIREAWARLSREQQSQLGMKIGKSVAVRVTTFDQAGNVLTGWACPSEAYLPAAIDREGVSFARAAGKTPGLKWIEASYATLLKVGGDRMGVGAQKLFVALGAARDPRLIEPPNEKARWKRDPRPASPIDGIERPSRQVAAIRTAPYVTDLLDDRWSPDLQAVVHDLMHAPSKPRVKRALALLSVLSRGWEKRYADFTTAKLVYGLDGYWHVQGEIVSTWLAQLSDSEWLPNGNNVLRPPAELFLPSAPIGPRPRKDRNSHLTSNIDPIVLRSGVLVALGLRSGPSARNLVDALRAARAAPVTPDLTRKVLAIYQELALTLKAKRSGAASDESMTPEQLRSAFRATPNEGGLVLADGQWRSPEAVLRGPRIFGRLRVFAPNVEGLEPLWSALQIAEPSLDDCIEVTRRLASLKMTAERAGIMVSTLRAMSEKLGEATPARSRALQRLPLWTGTNWSAKRPAYLIDAPVAAAVTRDMVVWEPGFTSPDLEPLLPALGVTRLRLENFSPQSISGASIVVGDANRSQFVETCKILQDELLRGDPTLSDSLQVSWEELFRARLAIDPELEISHFLADGTMLSAQVRAHMSREPLMFAVRSLRDAAAAESGGEAIASLFSGDRQKIAWAWAVCWGNAEAGERAHTIVLPSMKPQAAEAKTDRLLALQSNSRSRAQGVKRAGSNRTPSVARPLVQVRKLRNLDELHADEGRIVNIGANKRRVILANPIKNDIGGRQISLAAAKSEPRPGRAVLPSDSDREDLALEAVRRALRWNPEQICDLRKRRGLGADAVDELRQYYEIKMTSSAAVPHDVTLTASEAATALSEPDFFLAIVTGLEEGPGELCVRFIFDPLRALSVKLRGELTLTGMADAEALEYRFQREPVRTQLPDKG
jgi:hypothetical protein